MKRVTGILIILSILFSCSASEQKSSKLYKADLFFKSITLGTDIFSMEDENGFSLYDTFDSMKDTISLTDEEKVIKELFDFMKAHDLFGKPYFQIKAPKAEAGFLRVYTHDEDYKLIKNYKWPELQENGEKVIVKFYGRKLSDFELISDSIVSVKVVRGKTEWMK